MTADHEGHGMQVSQEQIKTETRATEFKHSVDNSSQNHYVPTPANSILYEPRMNITTQKMLK
jgi:hypothetical protein